MMDGMSLSFPTGPCQIMRKLMRLCEWLFILNWAEDLGSWRMKDGCMLYVNITNGGASLFSFKKQSGKIGTAGKGKCLMQSKPSAIA